MTTPQTLADIVLPPVPLTVEGASVLHQMMRVRWPAWRAESAATRSEILNEAAALLNSTSNSAAYSLLGHKGDLLFLHFRNDFADLNRAERDFARLRLSDYLEPT